MYMPLRRYLIFIYLRIELILVISCFLLDYFSLLFFWFAASLIVRVLLLICTLVLNLLVRIIVINLSDLLFDIGANIYIFCIPIAKLGSTHFMLNSLLLKHIVIKVNCVRIIDEILDLLIVYRILIDGIVRGIHVNLLEWLVILHLL